VCGNTSTLAQPWFTSKWSLNGTYVSTAVHYSEGPLAPTLLTLSLTSLTLLTITLPTLHLLTLTLKLTLLILNLTLLTLTLTLTLTYGIMDIWNSEPREQWASTVYIHDYQPT